MRRYTMVLLIAMTALFSGCATQQERVEHIRAKFPQLDQASAQQLAEGRIRVGMTEEMVATAKGKPRFQYNQDGNVVWEYVEYVGGEFSGMYIIRSTCRIYFKDQKVTDLQGSCYCPYPPCTP
jgi:hypothetical protein